MQSRLRCSVLKALVTSGRGDFLYHCRLGSPIEEMLPVYMDVKQKKSLPNGALAIIMHSCEINNGSYWAKATVQQAIQVLSPQDYAGVLRE